MKKICFLAIVAIVLSGCVNGKPQRKVFDSPLCGNVAGFTISYVIYGEGKMVMIPLSKVRPETVFVVKLRPMDGFDSADVSITGTSANAAWIGAMESYDNLERDIYPKGAFEVGCVPPDPEGTSYKFEVKVEQGDVKNILDPRARIVD